MKLKPIYVYKITLGLNGTFKQIENLHNTVKRITERLNEVNDFHGSIRVITENPEMSEEYWEMRIVTPPVPKDHRIVHALGGIKLVLFEEKRVYSMCDSITKATF